jgi:hypothetical protein
MIASEVHILCVIVAQAVAAQVRPVRSESAVQRGDHAAEQLLSFGSSQSNQAATWSWAGTITDKQSIRYHA